MPTIYFYGSIENSYAAPLRGGQQVTLRHVDVLRQNGFHPVIVTTESPLKRLLRGHVRVPSQFIHYSRFLRDVQVDSDVVVIPGRYLTKISDIPGNRKVVFSQGAFITFRSLGVRHYVDAPWRSPSLRAILCVSESNAQLFRLLNPTCPVLTIPNSVSGDIAIIDGNREDLVLIPSLNTPEKNPYDASVLVQLLRERLSAKASAISRVKVIELKDYPHAEVMALMQRARLLVFLAIHEGLPLLPIEAMRAGVLVLAWDRPPMSEFLPRECLVPCGDFGQLLARAESVLTDRSGWIDVARRAQNISLRFSEDQFRTNASKVWNSLLSAIWH